MKPISLILRGFIGIKKGMNRDEIALDLAGVAGLIAFDGKNGSGKTTLLDNLHPYRTLASRDGSLAHHVFLRDSAKEFAFELGGHKYYTLVKIDSHTGKQEGFIWKDGEPQVGGKATEYDKYIENLLGSPKLFFQSVFAAQGGDSLADMTTGDLKKLFAEFLQLDKLAAHEETAKQAAGLINDKVKILNQKIELLNEQATAAFYKQQELKNTRNSIGVMEESLEVLTAYKVQAEANLESAKDASRAHDQAVKDSTENRKRIAKIDEDLAAIRTSHRAAETEFQNQKAEIENRLAELKTQQEGSNQQEIIDAIAFTDKTLAEIADEIKLAEKGAAATQEDIDNRWRQREHKATDSAKQIANQEDYLAHLREDVRKHREDMNQIGIKVNNLANDRVFLDLSAKVTDLKSRADRLTLRDPECASDTCAFIVDAVKAKAELPGAETDLAMLRDLNGEKNRALASQQAEIDKVLASTIQSGEEGAKQLQQLKADAEADKQRDLKFINELAQSLQTVRAAIADSKSRHDSASAERFKLVQAQNSMPDPKVIATEKKAAEEKLQYIAVFRQEKRLKDAELDGELNSEKAGLASRHFPFDFEAAQRVTDLTEKITAVSRQITIESKTIEATRSDIAVLEHQAKEGDSASADLTQAQIEKNDWIAEMVQWQYIQNACGKNGLQALEIDGTAPLIAGYANDLLVETFGPGATVGFRTLDDDGKECLDIVVYREDDTDDKGTLLDNLSGGQQVWILKALRLALTLVSKAKSDKDISAALSDEEDGALDAEAAQSFIALYRAFMAAGGFEQCIYITHRDECKSLADHVIRLSDKGIEIDSGLDLIEDPLFRATAKLVEVARTATA